MWCGKNKCRTEMQSVENRNDGSVNVEERIVEADPSVVLVQFLPQSDVNCVVDLVEVT